jgi:hypothetical protein
MFDEQSDASPRKGSPERGLSVTESLTLVEAQQRQTRRRVHLNPAVLMSIWGVAWLAGFGAAFLAHGPQRLIPAWLGPTVPSVLIVAAMVTTTAYSIAVERGVSGPSRSVGVMYAWSWVLGFACLAAVNTTLIRRGLSSDGAALLWSGSALLVVGILYLTAGMLWADRVQYGMGVWVLLCAAAAVLAGVPGNFLILAFVGGGGFLTMAIFHAFIKNTDRR